MSCRIASDIQSRAEFHTEYLFERNLYWVYSDIHVTQIDWLTPHELLMNFIMHINKF